jgi:hypothetical protein
MYKSTPITKKAKTAGEYNSALKQADLVKGAGDAYRTTYKEEGSPGETITGRREKTKTVNTDDYDGSGGYMDNDKWEAWLKTEAGKAYTAKNTKEVGTGEFETFTEQKPGTDDFIGDIQEYKKQKRRVLGDLETRELNRTTKKTEKDLRRVKIKEAREARKQAKADGTSRKERRKAFNQSKRTAKQEEIANERAAFETRSKLNREAQAFGRKAGEAYEVDVLKTQGDYTKKELIDDAKNKRNKNRLAAQSIGQILTGFPMRAPMKKNYFKK